MGADTPITTEGQPKTETTATPPAPASSDAGKSTGTTLMGEQAQAKPAGAPESYSFKTPEGTNLDGGLMKEFEGVARELGLSQESAQKVVDKLSPAIGGQLQRVVAEQLAENRSKWVAQVEADEEIGGKRFDDSMKAGRGFLARFDNNGQVRKLLEETGLGDHPEVVRFFARAGKATSNDTVVAGAAGDQPAPPKDPVQRLAETFSRAE
jgi:hypothetical protein